MGDSAPRHPDTTTAPWRDRGIELDEGYQRLRQAILQGHFLPNERLIETDLAKTFHVGRAAIRTALARLEQDGLVERAPFRGARVRAISVAEAIEILEARAVLEGLAVRHATRYATPSDVAALRATLERMRVDFDAGDLLRVSEGNSQLHRQLLHVARHRTAARLIDALQAQNVRYQFRTVLVPGRASQSLEEHRAIVDAVAAGDPDLAEQAMRRHLDRVVNALRQIPAAQLDHEVSLI